MTIQSDEIVFLINKKEKQTQCKHRLIKGTIDESGQKICFVTNMLEEEAYNITELYRERWEIEVFFKLIKQHLNVKHLVSRNENGMKVMIYMTMILATLLIVYKKSTKLRAIR